MFLYEKDFDAINIYELTTDDEVLQKYRMDEMKKIPICEQVGCAVTGLGQNNLEIFCDDKDKIDSDIFYWIKLNTPFHKVDFYNDNFNGKNDILNKFYSGNFIDKKIAKVMDLKLMKYFLLSSDKYIYSKGKKVMEGIIQIPESLYLLSLIEQQKFSLLDDVDVSEQLKLFNLSYQDSIDTKVIDKVDWYQMGVGLYNNVLEKAENDAYILKKFR